MSKFNWNLCVCTHQPFNQLESWTQLNDADCEHNWEKMWYHKCVCMLHFDERLCDNWIYLSLLRERQKTAAKTQHELKCRRKIEFEMRINLFKAHEYHFLVENYHSVRSIVNVYGLSAEHGEMFWIRRLSNIKYALHQWILTINTRWHTLVLI